MTVNCQWISRNLEPFFCDLLTAEQDRLARAHIDSCAACREEIQGFASIDPLIKQHFRQQLAIARAPRRRSFAVAFGAAGVSAVAAILMLVVFLRAPETSVPTPTVSQPQMGPLQPAAVPPVIKDNAADELERAKPQPALPEKGARAESARSEGVRPDAPEFLVADAAGYSRTLADYRGRILILGIWSSHQPSSATNLEHIYRDFSANTKLRILGVSNERYFKPGNTTFPIAYNQGSRLLDTQPGDLVVIDNDGVIRYRGSLLTDSNDLVKSLRTALEPLGIR